MSGYQVKLPVFEGPFDLLYHLIEDQKINIYDIPIATITAQYLDYLQILEILDMEVASEFLVMAATLLEIKSKMLLPKEKPIAEDDQWDDQNDEFAIGDDDARVGLVNQLIEYKRFKLIALELRELERRASRIYSRCTGIETKPEEILQISISALDLIALYQALVQRRVNPPVHRVILDQMGIIERIREIRAMLRECRREISFQELLKGRENRYDMVLSFIALLEMHKLGELELKQVANFRPIQIHRPEAEGRCDPTTRLNAPEGLHD